MKVEASLSISPTKLKENVPDKLMQDILNSEVAPVMSSCENPNRDSLIVASTCNTLYNKIHISYQHLLQ